MSEVTTAVNNAVDNLMQARGFLSSALDSGELTLEERQKVERAYKRTLRTSDIVEDVSRVLRTGG